MRDLRVVLEEMEVVMRAPTMIFLVAATAAPAVLAAQEETVDGSATAIRRVVSGQTCTGADVLVFGESGPGSAETFGTQGSPNGIYTIGYGTILIRRGQDLHRHVTSVSVSDHVLHMSTGTYRCGE